MKSKDKIVSDSLLLILFWIVSSDDQVDDAELAFLSQYVGADYGDSSKVQYMLQRVKSATVEDYYEAITTLRKLTKQVRVSAVTLAIGVAVSDGRLAIPENHILRLLSDSLLDSQSEFEELYSELTGNQFPKAGDPSSKQWWDSKSSGSSRSKDGSYSERGYSNRASRASDEFSRSEALKVLGLAEGASSEEIKKAYRKLTSLHHPDKFHLLGDEAVQAANIIYRKILEAYEVLKQ